ncbi:RND family efflux transporter MFP subunit [Pseudomonas sp. MT-1]|nr:RND family efflux transporter MFP subunit [Pseudomonas sp. MT-1]
MQRQQAESDQYRAADWAISSTPLTIPTPETALTYTLYGNSVLVVKAGEAPRPEEGAEDALSGKVTPVEASLLANP